MRHLKSVLAVLGAATILVLAGNTIVMAATGNSLLLGKSNSANANTSITRTTSGSVLKLQSKYSSNAPLTVNGRGRVTNLNADKLDGYNSTSLRNRTYVFTSVFSNKSNVAFKLPVTNGSYIVTVSNFFADITGTGVQCFVTDKNFSVTTGWDAQNYVNNDEWKPAASATGYATKSSTSDIWVACGTDGPAWSTAQSRPLTITATQTDIVKKAALTPSDLPLRVKVPAN